uniref:FAD-binding FR-type domain-containing protein n=1 Tax=Anopheles epiroticus TaxID=199890 RepID=A0A182P5N1_9DIPT
MSQEDPVCCGSGCTNCVLDVKPSKHVLPRDAVNVFDRTYKQFICESITKATENVFRFRFRCLPAISNDQERLIIPPGCHLMLRTHKTSCQAPEKWENPLEHPLSLWRMKNPAQLPKQIASKPKEKYDKSEDDLYLSRPYTPIGCDPARGTFDVLIKLEPDGLMTNYLLTLSTGSLTEWKGVYGDFLWTRNQCRNVVAFVQGVAIAPIYSTLRAILDDEEDETRLTLCACFRDLASVAVRVLPPTQGCNAIALRNGYATTNQSTIAG